MTIWVFSQVSRFSSEPPTLIFESPIQSSGSSSLILEPPQSGVISSRSENPQIDVFQFSLFVLGFIPFLSKTKFIPKSEMVLHHCVFQLLGLSSILGSVMSLHSITEAKAMLWAKDWWRNSSYQQPFIWIKHGSNSVHGNVWKKYYVILLPWTLVIFIRDGHGFVLKHSILMNVPFIWGMRDINRSRNLWHQDKSVRINVGWRRKQKKKE